MKKYELMPEAKGGPIRRTMIWRRATGTISCGQCDIEIGEMISAKRVAEGEPFIQSYPVI